MKELGNAALVVVEGVIVGSWLMLVARLLGWWNF